jgi:Fe2+ or Zn2+ uptake regulation protein
LEAHDLESAFEQFEKKLSLRSSFADLSHSLEFYGVCGQCQ